MSYNRRGFIKTSVAAAAGIGLIGGLKAHRIVAPSDRINVGLIGARNMGYTDLKAQIATGGVNCIALCDVDQRILDNRSGELRKVFGQSPRLYTDFRKMLENKELDAVIIGTPDHWHGLMAVYACQAGLDVYLEKPMANTIEECNTIVRAADYYKRIVQIGQQQRSGVHWQKINRMVRGGRIGKLRKVNIWCNFNYGVGLPKEHNRQVPQGVDYDLWLGPAPSRDFNPNRFHRMWRMFWDYGGGVMTDWGVHLIDMALWVTDSVAPPKSVMALGGNLSFEDFDREVFDTASVIFDTGDFAVTWEQTSGTQNGPWGKNYGLAFVGDLGTIVVNREGYQVIAEQDAEKKSPKTIEEEENGSSNSLDAHAADFLECVRTRKTPACPPIVGRAVAIAAHSANIAMRTGSGLLNWDDNANLFANSREANKLLSPTYREPWSFPKF